MFETLKTKVSKVFNPKNKSAIARIFQNPDYVQDSEERQAQLLFLKLLMAIASADNKLDESEANLLKDYAFEQCLSGNEWQEVNQYSQIKVSKEEITKMIGELILEIKSVAQKENLLNAIKELIISDEILAEQEEEILEVFEGKLENLKVSIAANWVRGIKKSLLREKEKKFINIRSEEYVRNPVAVILNQRFGRKIEKNSNITGAKLGLALMLIYSDQETEKEEKKQFERLVSKYCCLSGEKSKKFSSYLLNLPEDHLEMAYLGEILVEDLNIEERKEFLKDLFFMARSDGVYNPFEDRDLRVISKYLLLDHEDFIMAKLDTKKVRRASSATSTRE